MSIYIKILIYIKNSKNLIYIKNLIYFPMAGVLSQRIDIYRKGVRQEFLRNNAVGIRIHDLPITPEKILKALKDSNLAG